MERTIAIVRDMRELAHAGDVGESRSELKQVLESCVRIASASNRRGATIGLSLPVNGDVAFAGGPPRQVFLNLLVNGLQAAGEGGVAEPIRHLFESVCDNDFDPDDRGSQVRP